MTGGTDSSADTDAFSRADTEVSRRTFVRGAAGVLIGGLALTTGRSPLGALPVVSAASTPVLGRSTFDKCVGQSFKLTGGSLTSLTLFKTRALRFDQPATPPPAGKDSFSLLFKGPANRPMAQGVYTLEHRTTGKFTVLVAPMRPEADALYYEVIFNRAPGR